MSKKHKVDALFFKAKNGYLPENFDDWKITNQHGATLAHVAAKYGMLPPTFDQWQLKNHWGESVAHIAAAHGNLPSTFTQWVLSNNNGQTVAHYALRAGFVPENFTHWEWADNNGWSVAHEAAQAGCLPADFTHWEWIDAQGWSVAHEAATNGNLPAGFTLWGLTDMHGDTVAHYAALAPRLPAGETVDSLLGKAAEAITSGTALQPQCTQKEKDKLTCPDFYINRELNWLDFNAKVLATGTDTNLPLLEQVKFISIFYNNLDEFFKVRVARLYDAYRAGQEKLGPDKLTATRQLCAIRSAVQVLLDKAMQHWKEWLLPHLQQQGVHLGHFRDLPEKQRKALTAYFTQEVAPLMWPQFLDDDKPFPLISTGNINFILKLQSAEGVTRLARVRCPAQVPHFVFSPRGRGKVFTDPHADTRDSDILVMEDLMLDHMEVLFPGHTVVSAGVFRITRDTDVEIEETEKSCQLMAAVKELVEQRRFGDVVRMEMDYHTSPELRAYLMQKMYLKPFQVYTSKMPMIFAHFAAIHGIDRADLKAEPFVAPGLAAMLPPETPLFQHLRQHDIFLYHPYQSFSAVLDFIQQAATDPDVTAIHQTLYRCGKNSPIVQSLIEARRRGKDVIAVVELKARDDEERNINWAEELEKAGVTVIYGIPGIKIHAKLCLVSRREKGGVQRYLHVATGNYNAATASMYTDVGLLTADEDICNDVHDLFKVMSGKQKHKAYRSLLVAPVTMRDRLQGLIKREIAMQKKHGNGALVLKCNQLVDKKIIRALYKASQAGVKIHLLIRGVCCLRPNVAGLSENITVTAIVGRFLEHARIYWFNNNGDDCLYFGSADLMGRNLDKRIEVLTPLLNAELRHKVYRDVLEMQMNDNMQAWRLCADGQYSKVPTTEPHIDTQGDMLRLFAH